MSEDSGACVSARAAGATIAVRPARTQDALQIVDVIRGGMDPELCGMLIYGCHGVRRYIADQIRARERGSDTAYVVAEDGVGVIGAVEMRLLPGELFLNYIGVLTGCRSMGLGTRLLFVAIEACGMGSAERMALDVFEDNTRAREWYSRLGFARGSLSEWWVAPLPRSEPRGRWSVSGCPQAMACHERFGFGQFMLMTAAGEYSVGLLGSEWFRITQQAALRDDTVLPALGCIDPARRVLAIVPRGCPELQDLRGAALVATSHRLRANTKHVVTALACQLGI